MPLLPAKTLDGVTVDETYFRDKVTLVTFLLISCPSWMSEIAFLNRLHDAYRDGGKAQVLCIAQQTPTQMRDFNNGDSSTMGKIRKAFGAAPIRYPIQPACPEGRTGLIWKEGSDSARKGECNTLAEVYGVTVYPALFFVDRTGVIRQVRAGWSMRVNDTAAYRRTKATIDSLLVP